MEQYSYQSNKGCNQTRAWVSQKNLAGATTSVMKNKKNNFEKKRQVTEIWCKTRMMPQKKMVTTNMRSQYNTYKKTERS